MTGDFDDILPEDLIGDGEEDQAPAAVMPPLRRSGRPRVPLKARRLPPTEGPDGVDEGGEVTPSETAGRGVVRTGTTKRSPRSKMAVLWVEPVGQTCPSSHPVKAIPSRGIFHVVGGQFYERTRPERCYRVPEAAEADGLRQAKR